MHPRIIEISNYLDEQRQLLARAFEDVPPWRRTESPRPGAWSAVAVIEHLAIVETRLAQALATAIQAGILDGMPRETETTPVVSKFPAKRVFDRGQRIEASAAAQPTGKSAEESWAALEAAGRSVKDALHAGDGYALNSRTMPHVVLGPISIYHMFAFVGAHEARHAAQLRDIAAHFAGTPALS